MTNYQTPIQYPAAIRFGSAKIEWMGPEDAEWINLGALKTVKMTTATSGEQKFEPDNAPPIVKDPTPDTWDISADVLECFNVRALRSMFGAIHTYTDAGDITTVGVYAGRGKRPYGRLRITNTTPEEEAVVITLNRAKITSEFDFTFPTDKDGTTSITLPATWKAELEGDNGFGTLTLPSIGYNPSIDVTEMSLSISTIPADTITVSGARGTVSALSADTNIATVSVINPTTVRVTAVAPGDTTVTVTDTRGLIGVCTVKVEE